MDGPVKELTYEDRAKWGTCDVCGATHGEWCYAEIGVQLGVNVNGSRLTTGQGAHLKRMQAAPLYVKYVPCSPPTTANTDGSEQ